MKTEETKRMIEVMQAYVDGKTIQAKGSDGVWEDWDIPHEPLWNWNVVDYRIKPEEEKPRLMTDRELSEWLARGNGEYTKEHWGDAYTNHSHEKNRKYEAVDKDTLIRPWGSDEWVKPTVDIYERDCKGEKK